MDRLVLLIGIGGTALVLFGILYLVQKNRTIEIPEGFTTETAELPEAGATDLLNPISKIMKKVTSLSVFFSNPEVWKDVITTSKLSFTDRARKQIEDDRKAKGV